MTGKFVEKRVDGSVCTLTITRPDALNALNSEVLTELEASLLEIDRDDAISVGVLTGSGDKAFIAGADIREMRDIEPLQAVAFAEQGLRVLQTLARMKIPVIAAVNGFALGGGFELALACDFIYAAESATFGFPEVGLGIIPGFGGTQTLPRLVGPNIARELIFTGKRIDAHQAKALGIVNEVIPSTELLDRAHDTARKIAANGGVAVALAKTAIAKGMNMAMDDALKFESGCFAILFSTEDQKEGMQAFVERRKPAFKNT